MDILIVGAGTAGLLLALECKRQGFNPVVLERLLRTEPLGMFGCCDWPSQCGAFAVIVRRC